MIEARLLPSLLEGPAHGGTSGGFFHRCANMHEGCADWAARGECMANPDFMRPNCGGSCGSCAPPLTWRSQQWRLFTADGVAIDTIAAVDATAGHGPLLLFEGGQWVWPGVREG